MLGTKKVHIEDRVSWGFLLLLVCVMPMSCKIQQIKLGCVKVMVLAVLSFEI
jgi:hypothetical protein